jgi:hypothetical protein
LTSIAIGRYHWRQARFKNIIQFHPLHAVRIRPAGKTKIQRLVLGHNSAIPVSALRTMSIVRFGAEEAGFNVDDLSILG